MNILKEILCWDLKKIGEKKNKYQTKKIPLNINSTSDFQNKVEPLFFEEFKSQLFRSFSLFQDLKQFNEGKVIWNGVKNKKFLFLIHFLEKKFYNFRTGDLIILSENKNKNALLNDIGFGLILSISLDGSEISVETNYFIWKKIIKKKKNKFLFRQISLIKSAIREFWALISLKKIPEKISNILFSNESFVNFKFFFPKKNFIQTHFENHFNKSQINGIFSILYNKINLIQGPPGTGKTRTILGIIGLILWNFYLLNNKINMKNLNFRNFNLIENFNKHHIRSKFFFDKNFNSKFPFLDKKIVNLSFFFKNLKNFKERTKERIMICAYSNAAIDENTLRISQGVPVAKTNFLNQPYSIIRLGPNYKFFLDHMTLDNYALIISSENDLNSNIWNSSKVLQKSRVQVLKQTLIIYTTLACASYSFFEKIPKKETLIMDEAAQAIEILTLAPLRSNCKKLIMIGDIQQLPATVFSQTSINSDYDRSLFKRLQLKKLKVWFLETQYRMHPQIASFIARKFYRNGLKDSENVAIIKNFQFLRGFGPMIFFDVSEGFDQFHLKQKKSWCNLDEIRLISLIIRTLICLFSNFNLKSIGIITSYQGQINEIQDFGILKKNNFKGQINTVDGFQGREKEIVFFSSVRAKSERGIGFLSDCRRINVAFTRARNCFWSIGNSTTLRKDYNWSETILDALKRGRFFNIRKPLERSNRRLIYWKNLDEENYCLDGENIFSLNFFSFKLYSTFFFLKIIKKKIL